MGDPAELAAIRAENEALRAELGIAAPPGVPREAAEAAAVDEQAAEPELQQAENARSDLPRSPRPAAMEFREYDYICKIFMVGDSGTGKTCLLGRFVGSRYEEDLATIGVDFVRTAAKFLPSWLRPFVLLTCDMPRTEEPHYAGGRPRG